MSSWFVYMIRCTDQSLYTGITTNLTQRWTRHAQGRGAKYFRSHVPQQVVYIEAGHTRQTASQREYQLKQLSRAAKEQLITTATVNMMTLVQTPRLTLRPIAPQDIDPLAAMWADPDVTRYLPTGQPRSYERSQQGLNHLLHHWQTHQFGVWAVLQATQFIGYAGLQYLPHSTTDIEVLYGLAKPYWGQGFAFEAAQAAVQYGFETLQLPRLIGVAYPANVASRRILEKLGLTPTTELAPYGHEVNYYVLKNPKHSSQPSAAPIGS